MKRSRVYLVLQAVVCIALVALISVSAIEIYREGAARKAKHPTESIYTPEAVAEKISSIAPLFFAGVGLLIAGVILGVKDEADPGNVAAPPAVHLHTPSKRTGIVRAMMTILAVVLIIAGVFNGSALDVLYKAITICTECVGLG
ncbi:MAG: hypothetical protein IKE24_09665 [Clostridia bacterium]|nr:hypothetical protein [Clostridia bacterium]